MWAYSGDVAVLVGAITLVAAALLPMLVLAVMVGAPGWGHSGLPLRFPSTRRRVPATPTHRPLSTIAADAQRLSERYHREGMRFAQYEGRRQAFDRVLGEAAEMLEVEHLLAVLPPGPELDHERKRIEARLVQEGLLPHLSEPA